MAKTLLQIHLHRGLVVNRDSYRVAILQAMGAMGGTRSVVHGFIEAIGALGVAESLR